MSDFRGFIIYKGLQAPLVFKGFKGKFIYWGAAVVFIGFIIAGLLSVTIGYLAGFLALTGALLGGFFAISRKQKKGLHTKKVETGIFIVTNNFKFKRVEKETI